MEHTKEPWATEYRATGIDDDMAQEIFDSDGRTIASLAWFRVRIDEKRTGTNREENARRIVACVNACEGIDTERLEINAKDPISGIFGRMASNAETDKKNALEQRDDLITAIKASMNQLEHLIPNSDPEKDEDDPYSVINVIITRSARAHRILSDAIEEVEADNALNS